MTPREKRLWVWTLLLVAGIYSTLGLAGRAARELQSSGAVDQVFGWGALGIAVVLVLAGLARRPGILEIVVALGVIASYVVVGARVASPAERTHLLEYSVVALLVLEICKERAAPNHGRLRPAIIAWLATVVLGAIDEVIQYFLPNRVFDPIDVGFNTIAATLAIGSSLALSWARRRMRRLRKRRASA